MKKPSIITVIALFLCGTAHSQCNWAKNEVDEFTGLKTRVLTMQDIDKKFTSRFWYSISMLNVENGYMLSLRFTSGQRPDMINNGDKLLIMLNNNEIVELEATETVITDANVTQHGTTYIIHPSYFVNRDMLEKISEAGIKKWRMHTSRAYLEYDFTRNGMNVVRQQIQCILSE